MVGKDLDWDFGIFQFRALLLEYLNDCQKLFIVDFIIAFGW